MSIYGYRQGHTQQQAQWIIRSDGAVVDTFSGTFDDALDRVEEVVDERFSAGVNLSLAYIEQDWIQFSDATADRLSRHTVSAARSQ